MSGQRPHGRSGGGREPVKDSDKQATIFFFGGGGVHPRLLILGMAAPSSPPPGSVSDLFTLNCLLSLLSSVSVNRTRVKCSHAECLSDYVLCSQHTLGKTMLTPSVVELSIFALSLIPSAI